MTIYQGNDSKKISGGVRRPSRKKRKYELGGYSTQTKIGSRDSRVVERVRGGNRIVRARVVTHANVYDPESKTYRKVKILRVVENKANREYVRLGIVTKGAIVETELGLAQITSRPSRDGVVNAVLVRTGEQT
ncbi:MAG: 30S ribosomal protein S8e [Sulfolobales archaeon]|nr:30S ribosomal protein S8e [Sulfolobales archaeon]MDW8083527.1 30S ribosomal protein S8e [Sulfolobales archaeon]